MWCSTLCALEAELIPVHGITESFLLSSMKNREMWRSGRITIPFLSALLKNSQVRCNALCASRSQELLSGIHGADAKQGP